MRSHEDQEAGKGTTVFDQCEPKEVKLLRTVELGSRCPIANHQLKRCLHIAKLYDITNEMAQAAVHTVQVFKR